MLTTFFREAHTSAEVEVGAVVVAVGLSGMFKNVANNHSGLL